MQPPSAVLPLLLAAPHVGDPAAVVIVVAALVASLTAFGFGVHLFRRSQVGMATLLFVLGTTSLFTCLGLSALTFVSQHASH